MKLTPRWTGVNHTLVTPGEYDVYVERGKLTYSTLYFVFHRRILISLSPLEGYNAMRCFLEECENFDNGERWGNIEYVYFRLLHKLNTACYLYYYNPDELMLSDRDFDIFEEQLEDIETKFPELISRYSPTQRPVRDFNAEQLHEFNQYFRTLGINV